MELTFSTGLVQGYRNIMANCAANAKALADGLVATGRFNILSKDVGVPLVAFSLKDRSQHDEYEIADHLRRYGWIVPAYTMAPHAQHISLLRVVVPEDLNHSLAERLVRDIEKVVHELDGLPSKLVRDVTATLVEKHPDWQEPGAASLDNGKLRTAFDEVIASRKAVKAWKKFVQNKPNRVC